MTTPRVVFPVNLFSLISVLAYISSSVTDEQLAIILSLMDYLLSDEGNGLYTLGIPGEDYTKDENGHKEMKTVAPLLR